MRVRVYTNAHERVRLTTRVPDEFARRAPLAHTRQSRSELVQLGAARDRGVGRQRAPLLKAGILVTSSAEAKRHGLAY